MVYTDVWNRGITHLEDPGIREVALGGPDQHKVANNLSDQDKRIKRNYGPG